MKRTVYTRKLKNIKKQLIKLEKGVTLVINDYRITKINCYDKTAFMVRGFTTNNYRVYNKNNIFQAAHSILSNRVYDINCILI